MLLVNTQNFKTTHSQRSLVCFDQSAVVKVERSSVSIVTKVNVLAIMLSRKWLTDLDIGLLEEQRTINLLNSVFLPWSIGCSTDGSGHKVLWIQAAANEAILEYVSYREGSLSYLELGLLYGYPMTHAMAFSRILDIAEPQPKNVAEFYFSGVFSNDFKLSEQSFMQETWHLIEKASPIIADQARLHCESEHKKYYQRK